MFYLGFADGDLLAGKSVELSLDLGVIDNGDFLIIIFQNVDESKVKLFWSDRNLGPIRIGANVEEMRLVIVGANNIHVKRKCDFSKFRCNESNLQFLRRFLINDP